MMKYFCVGCGTESQEQALCSGCGGMMRSVTPNHQFVLEIIDQVLSNSIDEPVVYERRGPFADVSQADSWWEKHHTHKRYARCSAAVVLIEPPMQLHEADKFSN